jgi:hypothetical protein
MESFGYCLCRLIVGWTVVVPNLSGDAQRSRVSVEATVQIFYSVKSMSMSEACRYCRLDLGGAELVVSAKVKVFVGCQHQYCQDIETNNVSRRHNAQQFQYKCSFCITI